MNMDGFLWRLGTWYTQLLAQSPGDKQIIKDKQIIFIMIQHIEA